MWSLLSSSSSKEVLSPYWNISLFFALIVLCLHLYYLLFTFLHILASMCEMGGGQILNYQKQSVKTDTISTARGFTYVGWYLSTYVFVILD